MNWKVRPAGDKGNEEEDASENDFVELEKSNILLMGPTGSGKYIFSSYDYFSCHLCSVR